MKMKFNILLFPGAVPWHTREASPGVTGEWWGSAASSRRVCHIWSTAQKWPETMFPWNLNSQPNSALVKVHQNNSISIKINLIPCNTSVLTKHHSPHRSTLQNSWQVLFTGLSSIRAGVCVCSWFLQGNSHFDSFLILTKKKKSSRMLFFLF